MSFFSGFLKNKISGSCIHNTIFSYGSSIDRSYGYLTLEAGGNIRGYQHPNESRWEIVDEKLNFISNSNDVTSRFHARGNDCWIGLSQENNVPLYLFPLITISEAKNPGVGAGVLVNSIPKAGTYFLEAALKDIGADSVRLHLGGRDIIDDYRGMDDAKIHTNPEEVRLRCPIDMIASLLHGRTVVGHIEFPDVIANIASQGVCVLNVKRNLRDVLVSMFRFKKDKVKARNGIDAIWREMSPEKQFISFLYAYYFQDIQLIRNTAELMVNDNDHISLSYEEMCAGEINAASVNQLDAYQSGLAGKLQNSLKNQLGKSNPTFSGKRSQWQDFWDEDIEKWFEISGFLELNKKLGYS